MDRCYNRVSTEGRNPYQRHERNVQAGGGYIKKKKEELETKKHLLVNERELCSRKKEDAWRRYQEAQKEMKEAASKMKEFHDYWWVPVCGTYLVLREVFNSNTTKYLNAYKELLGYVRDMERAERDIALANTAVWEVQL